MSKDTDHSRDPLGTPLIVKDASNYMTYICYPKEKDTLPTDSKWAILRIDKSDTVFVVLLWYQSKKSEHRIDIGSGILTTLRGYTTGWRVIP